MTIKEQKNKIQLEFNRSRERKREAVKRNEKGGGGGISRILIIIPYSFKNQFQENKEEEYKGTYPQRERDPNI